MVISLDAKPDKEEQAEDKRDETVTLNVMHGGGTNTPNRWLDKILNVCICIMFAQQLISRTTKTRKLNNITTEEIILYVSI
jgi:hypothetical protein